VNWNLCEFQIGYFADVAHEGQGFVTEGVKATISILFEKLNAHRVRLECDETNVRSIRVAERCGMTREGYLRENRRNSDGTYTGAYIYGLLKDEYQG
jgi:aminoglycoside 6'-N-acetyltransferase